MASDSCRTEVQQMTLKDWIHDTHSQFKRDPAPIAAKGAAAALWYGALRRATPKIGLTDDPAVIWDRDDWDVCVILDACRTDLWLDAMDERDYDWLPDTAETITSPGTMSAEWMENTFAPEHADEYSNAGLITGNPFSGKELKEWDHLPIRNDDVAYLDEAWQDGWEDNYGEGDISTIPPDTLIDRAIDAWRRRDELGMDRLVIHTMQPHAPFRSIPEFFGARRDLNEFGKPMPGGRTKSIWHKLRDDEVDRQTVWDGYIDNLHWALEEVERLQQNCDAEIAITSDHGNALGEWGCWGHPGGMPLSSLRNVPWVTVSGVDTGGSTPEIDLETGDVSDEEIEDRLAALGYV